MPKSGSSEDSSSQSHAHSPVTGTAALTPEAALQKLVDGNRRFISGQTTAQSRNVRDLRQSQVESQDPFACVLACGDSREPVEILFDQTSGDLFVVRVAGNMITPEVAASLEFGVEILSAKVILVLGHSNCGAVKAAIANQPLPGQIGVLVPYVRPAVEKAGPDPKAVTEANAKIQAQRLSEVSPLIAKKVKEGQLKVLGGYYDIGSGSVTLLD